MTSGVRFTAVAEHEFIEALTWYERRSSKLGARFQGEVDRQIGRIARAPTEFALIYADVRRARVRQFPYSLLFRVTPQDIVIIACFHSSRAPSTWLRRVAAAKKEN